MAERQRPGAGDGPGRVRLARLAAQADITSRDAAHRLHQLRGRPAPLCVRAALGAVRRRSRAAEHRARVHRPPCRRSAPHRHSHRPCRRARRSDHLPQPSPSSRRATPIGSPSRASRAGDRVAIMLEPSLAFYAALFGTMKLGAIAVPLFTLFGPDGVRSRVDDCSPRLLLTTPDKAQIARRAVAARSSCRTTRSPTSLARYPTSFEPATRGDDLAIFQYTSGTTRELPAAVRHTHRAIVVVMIAALYGTGIRPGDRFFCPSSPAWGHGLWHGTLAPLALGVRDRRLCRQVRRGAAAARVAGLRHHQPVGGGDALPHDAHLGRGVALSLRAAQAVVHRRADRQRQPGLRRARPSAPACAACTARPRSA